MLMILYKFNHATAVRGGFGGGADETPKIGPVRPPLNPPKGLRSGGVTGNATDLI